MYYKIKSLSVKGCMCNSEYNVKLNCLAYAYITQFYPDIAFLGNKDICVYSLELSSLFTSNFLICGLYNHFRP